MALNLDTSTSCRRPAELYRLVEAVTLANASDEQDWLEWKSWLDLTSKEGQFHISRAILGLANRDPAQAARHMGGLGYVVVGATAGSAGGLVSIDPADLDNALARYLGHDGPQWSPHNVHFKGVEVLVVIVEPPANGHPIFTLCKEYSGAKGAGAAEGTIFVRAGTKTRPATSADIKMLQRRLTAAALAMPVGPEIAVTLRGRFAMFDGAEAGDLIDQECDRRTDELLHTGGPPNVSDTWTRYVEEVTTWGKEWNNATWEAIFYHITEQDQLGLIQIAVENLSLSNLADVEVVLTIPPHCPIGAFDESGPEPPVLPPKPEPPSLKRSSPWFGATPPYIPLGPSFFPSPPSERYGTYVDKAEDGSLRISVCCGDIRPRDTTDEAAYLIAFGEIDEADLQIEWTATSRSLDGVRSGVVALPSPDTIPAKPLVTAVTTRD